ncbi:GspE/PulE family protein [Helicobacter kayseriensis]|uniref:GspE/PulE family protein n=1 Tax=Helicobacter kayseriensis TaxID=2905877 RepID=UPI001E5CA9F9|nr:GspE/PulE family protein [Helicobacter kayseriensis]MCE3047776.1 GspE/PulE family protein [Helicobacter kayseriensis]MCE3049125.1 GspE/PulE family protein [Helicobacter kayseriensis]
MNPKLPNNLSFSSVVPLEICKKLSCFIFSDQEKLIIATSQIQNVPLLQDILTLQYKNLPIIQITQKEFDYHISYAQSLEQFHALLSQVAQDEDLAIQKLIDFIFQESIRCRASDIHIESTSSDASIRIRIDSNMQELFVLPQDYFSLLSSSLKLECSLDIHEMRKPQDGRLSRQFDGISYDFRFSSLPTTKGESLVIRILCKEHQTFDLTSLGFSKDLKFDFPYGLIFVTGPTGSGKSTTLYAILESLKSVEKKIITLEDPVEYDLELLTQVAINEKYGFGFAQALRSILRQDPDIIMVGEIRDYESLSLALQSALTGHLVLSTLHTNDALSTIERLLDMQAKPYLIASILHLIIAQRLARQLCHHCKIPNPNPPLDLIPKRFHSKTFYQPLGCPQCNFKGYQGRILLYESLKISSQCKHLISLQAPKEELLRLIQKEGFVSIFEYGILQASLGRTSLEEVFRIAHEI